MRVITLLNEKGGVGKTTLATHIAMGLAHRGHRVILLDMDIQSHATLALGEEFGGGLYDLIVRYEKWEDVLRIIPPDRYAEPDAIGNAQGVLALVPSNAETRNIPEMRENDYVLVNRIKELEGRVDFVIIDTAPSASVMHTMAYLASDYVLYPTECQFLSMNGLASSIERRNIAPQQLAHIKAKTLGIIPTKYRSSTAEQKENLAILREEYGDLVWRPLAMRTIWSEAAPTSSAVWLLDHNSKAARDIEHVLNRIEGVVLNGQ